MSVTDLTTARRALYEARIRAADFNSVADQNQLIITLRREPDPELKVMLIDGINPDIAWQTLMALARESTSAKVAAAAASRLLDMKDEETKLFACDLVARGSKRLAVRALMAQPFKLPQYSIT